MRATKIPEAEQSRLDDEGRTYLAVPFAERHEAYDAGARWDAVTDCWYAPPHADFAKLERWLRNAKTFRPAWFSFTPASAKGTVPSRPSNAWRPNRIHVSACISPILNWRRSVRTRA